MSDFEGIFQAAKGTTEPVKTARRGKSQASVWDDLIPVREVSKRLNLDIPESTDKALAARAKKLKLTKAALVRLLIDSYLQNVE